MLRKTAWVWLLVAAALSAQDVVSVSVEAPKDPVRPGATFELKVAFEIQEASETQEAFHIYGPATQEYSVPTTVALVAKAGFKAGEAVFPPVQTLEFPAMGGKFDVYEGRVEVRLPVVADAKASQGEHELKVKVSYMACTKTSCLQPEEKELGARVTIAGEPVAQTTPPADGGPAPPPPPTPPPAKGSFDEALEKGLLFMMLVGFGSGLLGCLTPCVYPVIPVTISFFGSTGGGQQSLSQRVSRGFAYFLGIALFYGVLGLLAALLSLDVAPLLANPWVVGVLCAIFITLALSMFGLFEMNLPPSVLDKVGGRRQGLLGAFLLGAVMSLIAMPCVGPFVGNIFVLASTAGNRLVSFLGLLAFGIGLGFPFLFLSIFAGAIQSLPRSGEWMNKMKTFFGFMMLGMVIYFVRTFLPEKALLVACGVLAVFWGTFTGAFNAITAESGPGTKFGKALGLLIVVAGLAFLAKGLLFEDLRRVSAGGPAAQAEIAWKTGLEEQLAEAKKQKKPLIVDFTADN